MSEVLQLTVDDTEVRTLGVPGAVLDPATTAVVDAAVAAARAEGHAAGEAAGRAQAAADLERVSVAIGHAVGAFHAELAEQREAATTASLELAHAVATAVLDRTPPAETDEVLDRVRQAARILDAEVLTVSLHPADHTRLADSSDIAGLSLTADPAVPVGEARIDGPSCGADLTRRALLQAALEALGEAAT